MFRKLQFKYTVILILTIAVGLIPSCIIAYNTFSSMIMDDFIKKSVLSTKQVSGNIELYFKSIEETSNLIAHNIRVSEAIKSSRYDVNINPILDGIIESNKNIIGISIYGTEGEIYQSSSVADPPSLKYMVENDFDRQFISSSQTDIWLIRSNSLKNYYKNPYYYEKSTGIISYVTKIVENNRTIGYLIIDTSVKKLYYFYKNMNNIFQNNVDLYTIANEDDILSAPSNTVRHNDQIGKLDLTLFEAQEYLLAEDKNDIIMAHRIPKSDVKMIIYIPLEFIHSKLEWLKLFFIVFCIVVLIVSLIACKLLLNSIFRPLSSLYFKMQKPIGVNGG